MPLSQFDRENVVPILQGHGDWFTAQLMRLVVKADGRNRTLLARGFPEEVQLVEQAWGLTSTEPEALLREHGTVLRRMGTELMQEARERQATIFKHGPVSFPDLSYCWSSTGKAT